MGRLNNSIDQVNTRWPYGPMIYSSVALLLQKKYQDIKMTVLLYTLRVTFLANGLLWCALIGSQINKQVCIGKKSGFLAKNGTFDFI